MGPDPSAQRMAILLGVSPGSVTPFSLMHAATREEAKDLRVVVDAGFRDFELNFFHPLHNAASTGISFDDLVIFIKNMGFDPIILNLGNLANNT